MELTLTNMNQLDLTKNNSNGVEYKIKCPKCSSNNVSSKRSCGGFAIYENLECDDCHFEGGLVRVYTGEQDRVDRQTRERFTIENKTDDCKAFVSSITGY